MAWGMEPQVLIPSPAGDNYVELARQRNASGVVFRKHLLNLGQLIHPKTGETLTLDEKWYDQLKQNFDNQVCDIVAVPLADGQNRHTEHPLSNVGEVIGIERDGNKIYSLIDVRDEAAVKGLRSKTLLGASAFLHLDYKDTKTNKNVGPALLHHCVTNRPYVTGLDDYEEIAASAAQDGEVVVLSPAEEEPTGQPAGDGETVPAADKPGDRTSLSQEDPVPELTQAELIAQLKDKHGIDVGALQTAVAAQPDMSQLTAALTAALQQAAPTLQLSAMANDGQAVELTDVVGAVAELAQQHRVFGDRVVALERQTAEQEIDGYISEGRVLPKQREAYVRMALTARDQLDLMLPDRPIVALNNVTGSGGRPQGEQKQEMDIDQEVLRLTAEHAGVFDAAAKRDPRQRVLAANRAAAAALTNGHGDATAN
jgi:Mu-like prophage I protein